jgi:hypothetical protein
MVRDKETVAKAQSPCSLFSKEVNTQTPLPIDLLLHFSVRGISPREEPKISSWEKVKNIGYYNDLWPSKTPRTIERYIVYLSY